MSGKHRSHSTKAARYFSLVLLTGGLLAAGAPPAAIREQPLLPEKNPPGDIPDSQVFILYRSPSGYQIQVPEGWSRAERAGRVRFSDKFNAIEIEITQGIPAGAAGVGRSAQLAELEARGRAVTITTIRTVNLPAGRAEKILYTANSGPNPVTRRQIRLEHARYLIERGRTLAVLDLSAPQGADNADQWRRIAGSFRWN